MPINVIPNGIEAPQIASPLQNYAQGVQLKSLLQQTQMQDMQMQDMQRQRADEQAAQQIIGAHNGDLISALPDLSSKVTPKTFVALQKTAIELKKSYGEMKKTDIENEISTSDQILGLITQSKQLSPEEYAQRWPEIAQRAVQINPKLADHVNPAQPIPQQGLDSLGLGYLVHSQLAKRSLEERQAAESAAKVPGEIAHSTIEQQNAALGPEGREKVKQLGNTGALEMNDWLSKNPGKGPSDYVSWKAKQSPFAITLQNMLPQGPALDQAAERYSQSGELAPGFSRSPQTTAAIIKRSAELHPDQSIAANKATFKADEGSLKKLQTNFDQVSAFEGTALRNLDLYVSKAKAIPDLGTRFADVPLRSITKSMIGEKNYAAMNAARQIAATETAKVLGSATASGVLSDSQKKDALDVLDGNLPFAATVEVVNTLKQDFGNRHQSYQLQLADIKGRLTGKPQGAGTNSQSDTTDPFAQFGGKSRPQ